MSEQVARCNLCPKDKQFEVPWSGTPADNASAAIMKQHFSSEHGVSI